MRPRTVIIVKKTDGEFVVKSGKQVNYFPPGVSRLFRQLPKLIEDKDNVTSIRLEINRTK